MIDSRSGVQNFRIADLEISGNPKLLIYSGPNDYQVFGNQDQEMFEISESQPENESVVNCIPIALQVGNKWSLRFFSNFEVFP